MVDTPREQHNGCSKEQAMARRKFTREFKMSAVQLVNQQGYSVPEAAKSLGVDPNCVRQNTVAKIMRAQAIRARTKKKFVPRTTDGRHGQPLARNVLDRQFAADLPDQKWAVDITYVPTDEGWLYLAGVIDLCSRRIVGWSMADHMQVELVSDALRMAIARRRPDADGDLLHHSDRGVQYASEDYMHILQSHGMRISM